MRRPKTSVALFVALFTAQIAAAPPPAPGRAVAVSDHALASACGSEILADGGNAADAAVAVALCAGVVQPASSGLGGGGFAVVAGPAGTDVLDFREVAPGAASRDMYLRPDGSVDPDASQHGALAVAVPSESRGLATLLARHGTLSPRAVAAPAVRLASRGFEVEPHLGSRIAGTPYGEVAAELSVGEHPATVGERVVRPDLARTLRRWAATAGEDLHTGRGAAAVVAHVAEGGGVLSAEDLAAVSVVARAPIVVTYRGWEVITMPPPSSGGVVLAQALRVLEATDVSAIEPGSAAWFHLLAETLQHGFADRAHYLGDPAFVDVPVERLLSDDRVAAIRAAFDPDATLPAAAYGPLLAPPQDAGTQHISVLDADGMAVALTTTINTTFGAGLVAPGTGVILNDQMDDFSAAPGTPNAYGLVGGEANAIAPGKRPLSSMSPTVLRDPEGRVRVVVGASGGSTIISGTLQAILAIVDHGMDPAAAVAMPRMHHQWTPKILVLEPEVGLEVRQALEARGHVIKVMRAFSSVQAISVVDGVLLGGADPRKGGRPAVVPTR